MVKRASPQPVPSGFGQPYGMQPQVTKFCPACGHGLVTTAVICPHCGTATGSPKSKTSAVLLAVFLWFWTWLYTYQRSKGKFWTGLALAVVGAITAIVGVGLLVWLGLWIWAIVDTASKPDEFYTRYPNG